jgi:hypothetical protein
LDHSEDPYKNGSVPSGLFKFDYSVLNNLEANQTHHDQNGNNVGVKTLNDGQIGSRIELLSVGCRAAEILRQNQRIQDPKSYN